MPSNTYRDEAQRQRFERFKTSYLASQPIDDLLVSDEDLFLIFARQEKETIARQQKDFTAAVATASAQTQRAVTQHVNEALTSHTAVIVAEAIQKTNDDLVAAKATLENEAKTQVHTAVGLTISGLKKSLEQKIATAASGRMAGVTETLIADALHQLEQLVIEQCAPQAERMAKKLAEQLVGESASTLQQHLENLLKKDVQQALRLLHGKKAAPPEKRLFGLNGYRSENLRIELISGYRCRNWYICSFAPHPDGVYVELALEDGGSYRNHHVREILFCPNKQGGQITNLFSETCSEYDHKRYRKLWVPTKAGILVYNIDKEKWEFRALDGSQHDLNYDKKTMEVVAGHPVGFCWRKKIQEEVTPRWGCDFTIYHDHYYIQVMVLDDELGKKPKPRPNYHPNPSLLLSSDITDWYPCTDGLIVFKGPVCWHYGFDGLEKIIDPDSLPPRNWLANREGKLVLKENSIYLYPFKEEG